MLVLFLGFPCLNVFHTFGGILCSLGFVLQSRKSLRDNFKDLEPSPDDKKLDRDSSMIGFSFIAVGTVIWAVTGIAFK